MAQTHAATADALFSALRENHAFPDSLSQTLTIDEAYLVQEALLDQQCRNGETQAGWKVGLTSKAMQA